MSVYEIGKKYHVTREDCCLAVDVVGILLDYDPGDWGDETFTFDFGTVYGTRIRLEEVPE